MNSLELSDIKTIAELDYNWSVLSNKTLLISGGTGFIGSFLCDVLAYRNEKYHQNIKVISLSRRGGENSETVQYKQADITKPFIIDEEVNYVIHLASNTHPKQYAEDPIGTITTNIFGCYNLLNVAKEKNARFVLASSVEIYGQGTEQAMDESYCGYIDCNQARAGYNESKRVSESLLQSFRVQYGLDALIVRFSRIFGADKKEDTKALAQFVSKAINNEDIILKSKGNQKFSYCYVADAVSGLLKVIIDGKDGEAYNVSGDYDGQTLGDLAQYVAGLSNKKVVFDIENNPAASKATYAILSCDKIKNIGWKPIFTIKDGLDRTYQIIKDRKK